MHVLGLQENVFFDTVDVIGSLYAIVARQVLGRLFQDCSNAGVRGWAP